MNKAMIMLGVAIYVLGAGMYFITYVASHWGDPTYFAYVAAEGFANGLMWPYRVYAWFRFDAPIM